MASLEGVTSYLSQGSSHVKMALALRKRGLSKDSMSFCPCSCDKIPVKSNLRSVLFGSQFKETVHCGGEGMEAGGWSLQLCSIYS